MRRLASIGYAIYLPSGDAGEAHVLTRQEMRLVCDLGVAEAKGKVQIGSTIRESQSAEDPLELAKQIAATDVDIIQLSQLDARHGMIPTESERGVQGQANLPLRRQFGLHARIGGDSPTRFHGCLGAST